MRGHIREVGEGRWKIWFDITPDPVTGKRRQRTRTIVGSRGDAEMELARILADLDDGAWVDDGSIRLQGFVVRFLEIKQLEVDSGQLAPGTLAWYRQKLGYVTVEMGGRRLSQITGPALTALYGRLLQRGLSRTTVSHVHAAVRAAYRTAIDWGLVKANPTDRAKSPGRSTGRASVWTAEDLRRFLDAAADTPWLVAYVLLATTGMRRSEVAGLRWRNVDLDGAVISMRETLTSTGGRLHFGAGKTRSSIRSIAVDTVTVDLLRVHRRAQLTQRLASEGGYEDSDMVIAWPDGRPVNPDILTRAFRRLSDRLSLPHIRLHDLRHTWATLALVEKVELEVVSHHLGHSSIKVTADVYRHVTEGLDRDAAERVAKAIRGR